MFFIHNQFEINYASIYIMFLEINPQHYYNKIKYYLKTLCIYIHNVFIINPQHYYNKIKYYLKRKA